MVGRNHLYCFGWLAVQKCLFGYSRRDWRESLFVSLEFCMLTGWRLCLLIIRGLLNIDRERVRVVSCLGASYTRQVWLRGNEK